MLTVGVLLYFIVYPDEQDIIARINLDSVEIAEINEESQVHSMGLILLCTVWSY